MCCHLVLFCHLPLSTSLLFWGVVEESWLVVVGAIIVLGSGVAGLSVPCPHAHTPTPPTTTCTPLSRDLPFSPRRILSSVCSSSSRRGRCCFPHAQAVVLPDLMQLGEELPFSGHSRFLQSGIGYVFLCVLWSGASSLAHRLFGVVFPCCEPCSLLVFWGCVFPTFCWLWCSISFWAIVDFQSVG